MAALRSTTASQAWRSLLIAFTDVRNELSIEMEENIGLPMEQYEILLMLFEAGADGMRASEIADKRRLSRSGATRLVDRLVDDELVTRQACGTDRRGTVVVLSASGKKTFTRAGQLHLAGIEREVGGRLTADEMTTLQSLLEKLAGNEKLSSRALLG